MISKHRDATTKMTHTSKRMLVALAMLLVGACSLGDRPDDATYAFEIKIDNQPMFNYVF